MAIHASCTVLGVIGGKGGVGKSVFAANLASALMLELRTQVLLVDGDSRSVGDQNVIMGLKPNKTIKELSQFTGSINPQNLNNIVSMHSSGLAYLGAVRGPEEVLNVSPDHASKIIENLSRIFKFIVIDLGSDLSPLQQTFLVDCTALVLVTTPEVLVVTQTQRLVNDLLSLTFPRDMFQLVINKSSPQGLSAQAISNQLQLPMMGLVPQDDLACFGSLQKGLPFVLSQPKSPLAQSYFDFVRRLTGGVIQRLKSVQRPTKPAGPSPIVSTSENSSSSALAPSQKRSAEFDPRTILKIRVHQELIRNANLDKLLQETRGDESKQAELRDKTKREITQIVDREGPELSREDRSKVIKEVLEESLGLGPLEDLLADSGVTEIMVNGHQRIFIEKSGKVELSPVTFTSNDHLRRIIERIVSPLGRQINNSSPYVDARLKDGSRVNAIIEPLSIDGPALTIRKFKKGGISAEKYIDFGTLNKGMIEFLRMAVENGMNVVISGGTGSGKTTLLNMLSSFIPAAERIITVEDAAELQLQQTHVVRLETRPPSMDGSNAITIRDLIKNALRMRPDRIIVGECRDGAALDMLQAMNTGHDGSMTTTHANTPRECLSRLETLCLMAGMDLPSKAIREQISKAVHIIVQISRLSDGSRRVMSICEVGPIQSDTITLGEIFKFKETGWDKNRKIQGQFQATGTIPSFIQKLSDKGIVIPKDLFTNEQAPSGSGNISNHRDLSNALLLDPMGAKPSTKKTGS